MRTKSQSIHHDPRVTVIERLSHDARGLARIQGKTTFIDGALPNETVSFQYTRRKTDFDEGRLVEIQTASEQRVTPKCAHYGVCGGCSLQHLNADAQIHEKQNLLLDVLNRIGHCAPETVLAPLSATHWHYRDKARLSVRYVEKKQAVLIGFREKYSPRYIAQIEHCSVLNKAIDEQLPALRQLIESLEDRHCIAQIEVAVGDEIALIFRNLNQLSDRDLTVLCQFGDKSGFRIFLQPDGPDSVYLLHPADGVTFLSYSLPEHAIRFEFHPTDFTQVNAELNRLMVNQALGLLDLKPQDVVLDLFCGLGNFSLPIAKYCTSVMGIEGVNTMVERARMNAANNGLTNAKFQCINLDDEVAVMEHLSSGFNKVLLDPPRSGAMQVVKRMNTINPQRIVYVSCNPATLARDSAILIQQGFRMVSAGVMDMFPHTAHVESIALFERV